MQVDAELIEDIVIARVKGRVDGANAIQFWKELRAAIGDGDQFVIVDLADLRYVSSSGLRVFMLVAKERKIRHRGMALCSLSNSVEQVFEIIGIGKIIPIYASRSDAIAAHG